jgi:hypothetical protein
MSLKNIGEVNKEGCFVVTFDEKISLETVATLLAEHYQAFRKRPVIKYGPKISPDNIFYTIEETKGFPAVELGTAICDPGKIFEVSQALCSLDNVQKFHKYLTDLL